MAKHDLEAGPVPGDAGREKQERALTAQAENRFNPGLIHPPGRARVPRPSTASDMRRFRIDVGGDDVRLDLVAMHAGPRGRVVNGIDQREQASVHRYKVEPYIVAADVYSESPHVGRGGWTWYTGSAGWMYQAGIESILG